MRTCILYTTGLSIHTIVPYEGSSSPCVRSDNSQVLDTVDVYVELLAGTDVGRSRRTLLRGPPEENTRRGPEVVVQRVVLTSRTCRRCGVRGVRS